MDTFPRPSAWAEQAAYSGRIAGDRVYGTGAGDMRAGIAIALLLADLYRGPISALRGSLVFAFSSDEESGGERGARVLAREVPEISSADACLVGDQIATGEVGCAEKGFCWMSLTARATGGHAAYRASGGAVETVLDALTVARSLDGLQPKSAPSHGLAEPDLAGHVTVNATRLEGGVAPNLVPELAGATIDVRLPIGIPVGAAVEELERRLEAAGVGVSIDVLCASDATLTDRSAPIVGAALRQSDRVGQPRVAAVRVGMSDAHIFRQQGIPAVVLGAQAHNLAARGEFVEIDDLVRIARVHAGIIEELLR
jgi:succinyl-diaminopimelate desuccinylase